MRRTTVVTRTNVTNAVLAVVLLGLLGWLLVFAFRGAVAAPGSTPAEERVQEYSDVSRAASELSLAFLSVDHERMDELTARVLSGLTGEFKKEYQSSVETIKDAVIKQESVAIARVEEVGLGEVDGDSASVFVAASSKVTSKDTKGEARNQNYQLRLAMAKVGDRWLVSKLEVLG